jgi:hypothetical protein
LEYNHKAAQKKSSRLDSAPDRESLDPFTACVAICFWLLPLLSSPRQKTRWTPSFLLIFVVTAAANFNPHPEELCSRTQQQTSAKARQGVTHPTTQ